MRESEPIELISSLPNRIYGPSYLRPNSAISCRISPSHHNFHPLPYQPLEELAAGYVINICSNPRTLHSPVCVSSVTFVPTVSPLCNAPLSTFPPATLRCKWFAPALTVKFARLISYGLRVATDGEPVVFG
jgi:hypothetical protein